MIAIYRRELRGLFRGIMAWLLIAGWLMLGSLFVVRQNLGGATSLFANAVLALSDYIVLGMPFLAARCFTKDQSNGTMLWLRSLPVSATGLFLGKYLAALTVFAIPTVFLAVFPMLLDNFGYLSYGSAYTALFGYFLLGASWLAICCWVASVCRRVCAYGHCRRRTFDLSQSDRELRNSSRNVHDESHREPSFLIRSELA